MLKSTILFNAFPKFFHQKRKEKDINLLYLQAEKDYVEKHLKYLIKKQKDYS